VGVEATTGRLAVGAPASPLLSMTASQRDVLAPPCANVDLARAVAAPRMNHPLILAIRQEQALRG